MGLKFGGYVLADGWVDCGLRSIRASQGLAAASTSFVHRWNFTGQGALSVLKHSSSCMHSCDVSLCVGSRGAWSEVHVGQYGSAVVMTIILLITVLHKKVIGCK